MSGSVTLKIKDGIGSIEFYHPKGNSLPKSLLEELEAIIYKAGYDDEVNVIVLKSRGNDIFCAGASFDELMELEDETTAKEFFMGFALVIQAMIRCSKLIIVRVEGKAVGGGVGIIAAADYVLAHSNASIKLSELNLGIGPFVIAPVIEKKIGTTNLANLALNPSQWRDSDWALEKGLYNQVFDSEFDLDNAVKEKAAEFSTKNRETLTEIKRMLWAGFDQSLEDMESRAIVNGRLVMSEYTREFIRKFKAK